MSFEQNLRAVEGLRPEPVWRYFAMLASVPRPSKQEAAVRERVRSEAREQGLEVAEDAAGNLRIDVPASKGRESAPVTILQGHLDMVCEKNAGTEHDFDTDPIRLRLGQAEGKSVIQATGTTLGADNGIGVALALAAATSAEVVHGPLEILLTIDEETGMTGVKNLEPSFLRGRRLLNLDSEEDNAIYIGCAGGADATLKWRLSTEPVSPGSEACRVRVGGLAGGHSGTDIHKGRGNANLVLLRVLASVPAAELRLIEAHGGSKRNAIAREAEAWVVGRPGTPGLLTRAAEVVRELVASEQGERECEIAVEPAPSPPRALSPADTARVLNAITVLPHGVLAVEPSIPGLIRTSNNIAILEAAGDAGDRGNQGSAGDAGDRNDEGSAGDGGDAGGASDGSDGSDGSHGSDGSDAGGAGDGSDGSHGAERMTVTASCLTRSSSMYEIRGVLDRMAAVAALSGAEFRSGNAYGGWKPNVDSPLLKTTRESYVRLFGSEPKVTAIHAGLECGILGDRIGGLDMVSIGPNIEGAHSPDERVYVESVEKSWKLLTTLLDELSK